MLSHQNAKRKTQIPHTLYFQIHSSYLSYLSLNLHYSTHVVISHKTILMFKQCNINLIPGIDNFSVRLEITISESCTESVYGA